MPEHPSNAKRTVDRLVAGALAGLAIIQAVIEWRTGTSVLRVTVVALAGFGAGTLLLLRRRFPIAVVVCTAGCAALVAVAAEHPAAGPIAPAVALYTLAAQANWRDTLSIGTAALAILTLPLLARGAPIGGPLAESTAVLGAAALIGLYAGGQAQVSRALADRAAQLEREQAILAREAALAERIWIARELHDTIGHHVSLLVVQAGGVRATLPADHPARPVLDSMIAGGKEAMTETRRMVDVLRPVGEESGVDRFAATPGLTEIPQLCSQLRRSGLPIDLRLSPGEDVPRTASVAAYRIVQEALTNVVKHAGLVPTRVRITRSGEVLDIRVTNAASAAGHAPVPGLSGGHGHTGIRERVVLFGGRFFAGPVPDGGYAIQATLALRATA
jgi:signal transduction histidine kinase